MDRKKEFEMIVDAYEKSGGQKNDLLDKRFGSLVVNGTDVLQSNVPEGVSLEILSKTADMIEVKLIVEENVKMEFPVHMCFGMAGRSGRQHIVSHYEIRKNAEISVLTHCAFPGSEDVTHIMNSSIVLQSGSRLEYTEQHYHSDEVNISVEPYSEITVGRHAYYSSDFVLKNGRVGKLKIDYHLTLNDYASAVLRSRIFGKMDDDIYLNESADLEGKYSNAVIKSRIAATDNTNSVFKGRTAGLGDYSRGHIDCTEIIEGNGHAEAIPIVSVSNKTARVTHEAAIGSVDKKQLETLMARGIGKEDAVDIIVNGMLD
ncbi:MAG: SufD family Fe-S cluster assembly protein [candidate division WOR-3 bacterium]|nr:SufD family Fe-S cluster assembly protein [candidate division WOR-3 bacterium]